MRLWPLPGCDGTGVGDEHFVDELTGFMSRLFTAKGLCWRGRAGGCLSKGIADQAGEPVRGTAGRKRCRFVTRYLRVDGRFFDDAINALGAIGNYGATFFYPVKDLCAYSACGLQVARSPGMTLVCIVFIMSGVTCTRELGSFVLLVISSVVGAHRFICHTVHLSRGEQVFVGAALLR